MALNCQKPIYLHLDIDSVLYPCILQCALPHDSTPICDVLCCAAKDAYAFVSSNYFFFLKYQPKPCAPSARPFQSKSIQLFVCSPWCCCDAVLCKDDTRELTQINPIQNAIRNDMIDA